MPCICEFTLMHKHMHSTQRHVSSTQPSPHLQRGEDGVRLQQPLRCLLVLADLGGGDSVGIQLGWVGLGWVGLGWVGCVGWVGLIMLMRLSDAVEWGRLDDRGQVIGRLQAYDSLSICLCSRTHLCRVVGRPLALEDAHGPLLGRDWRDAAGGGDVGKRVRSWRCIKPETFHAPNPRPHSHPPAAPVPG
jgi:hypothetical protein